MVPSIGVQYFPTELPQEKMKVHVVELPGFVFTAYKNILVTG